MIHRRDLLASVAAAGSGATAGCLGGTLGSARPEGGDSSSTPPAEGPLAGETLTLATTTSAYDTGLVHALNAAFEEETGASVRAVARGTGGALRTARDGDADAVLVHAPDLEREFVESGYGVERRPVFVNNFLVVGPSTDPAGLADRGTPEDDGDVAAAFRAVADAEASFVSRGDNSGTHRRELACWDAAEVEPAGDWYRLVGAGMGNTLVHAGQVGGYTLTDRGSYLGTRHDVAVDPLFAASPGDMEGVPDLLTNPYSIITVHPDVPGADAELGGAYAEFLDSPAGREVVESFRVDGERAFRPLGGGDDG